MKEVIDMAADGKYSEFSKKVKQSLGDKLKNHDAVKSNGEKLKSFEDMKDKFAQISVKPEEAEETVDTEEIEDTEETVDAVDAVDAAEDTEAE